VQLRRVLLFSAIVGFAVPIASYVIWQLSYAIGLGKALDDWNARVELFASLQHELSSPRGLVAWTWPPTLFDWVFWDVLWVAIINALLYMALGSIWRALVRHKPKWRLSRILAVAAIVGFAVPILSYFVWFLLPRVAYRWMGAHLVLKAFMAADVLTVAVFNLPLFMSVGSALWMLFGDRLTRYFEGTGSEAT
jgi:hypothetical protein